MGPEEESPTCPEEESPIISSETLQEAPCSGETKRQLDSDDTADGNSTHRGSASGRPGQFSAPAGFKRMKKGVVIDHIDIISPKFWSGRGAYVVAPEKRKI
jgi:hypothetical protein